MGLIAKSAKKIAEQHKEFEPLELNEGNVQAIFNRCLATKSDSTGEITSSTLFQKALGYDEDSKPVFFSKKKIEENKKSILYMLGQLKSIHNDNINITSSESIYRYDDIKWTTDTVKLMELYHLGERTRGIRPFVKQSNTASISRLLVKPTLSPKDPNFQAWWAQHKSEWETPKRDVPYGPEGH